MQRYRKQLEHVMFNQSMVPVHSKPVPQEVELSLTLCFWHF